MKVLKYSLSAALIAFLALACNDGIDPISSVAPGPDETAPAINIMYPLEGTEIKVASDVAPINIKFEVTDDIEVQMAEVLLNGNQIATFTEFKDYRRFLGDVLYESLATGQHTLTVNATDLDGKTTSKSVNFSKVPPYVPKYSGEIFYMPFDQTSGYTELVTFTNPTVVGTPGFTPEGAQGQAYAGATDSYLTFPTAGLQGNEFSAFFWMKVNAVPDRAGVLVMGPPDPANPSAQNLRTSGFRFFRENADGKQRFKLNVGDGGADSWFDGGAAADVDPTSNEWVSVAFTISATQCVVYINGQVVSQGPFSGVSWEGCDILSIMSGAPRFTEWDHKSDLSYMDELRLFNKALTQEEIQSIAGETQPYDPTYAGEVFYMPFEGSNADLVSGTTATVVGSPGFAGEGVSGNSYAGAADSYLTFPAAGLMNEEFSATFWYNVNASPDRSGILTISPPNPDNPGANNLKNGFRFFREGSATNQIFKLNVGFGTDGAWFDGGAAASINPTTTDWVFLSFTISGSHAVVYINGQVVSEGDFAGIDWSNCTEVSIASGAPNFIEWNHLSDLSLYDELRFYNKVLTQGEIETIMND